MKYKQYWFLMKDEHKVFITALSLKEAFEKIHKLLPTKEIVGYYEV